jgi:hypothetical protein
LIPSPLSNITQTFTPPCCAYGEKEHCSVLVLANHKPAPENTTHMTQHFVLSLFLCHPKCCRKFASSWITGTDMFIGPRGLSFEILSVWVPPRALYHFTTMVGLGPFLCPRRFFLSIH